MGMHRREATCCRGRLEDALHEHSLLGMQAFAPRRTKGLVTGHACEVPPHDKLHREHPAAPHDGHVGVWHRQQRIGCDVLRLMHPPCAGLVQHLPLQLTDALTVMLGSTAVPFSILWPAIPSCSEEA